MGQNPKLYSFFIMILKKVVKFNRCQTLRVAIHHICRRDGIQKVEHRVQMLMTNKVKSSYFLTNWERLVGIFLQSLNAFLLNTFLHKFICWIYFVKLTDEFWAVHGSCSSSSERSKWENLCLHSFNANWLCIWVGVNCLLSPLHVSFN